MTNAYPVILLLEDKRAVVIGGGAVAQRKIEGLIDCGAIVNVIAPEATDGIRALVEAGKCTWKAEPYDRGDLADADIVFAATDDEDVNARVFADATAARLMVNVADRPELCSFFLPSVMRRGDLSVSVSTRGSAPLLARRIRERLEDDFDGVWGDYVALLRGVRDRVNTDIAPDRRKAFWDEACDGRVMDRLRQNDTVGAAALLDDVLDAYTK